jgi:ribosomal-protein-serine acetyltransferase
MFSTSITDGVVTLRPLRADDAVSMYEAICESLADLRPWMSWAHDDYRRDEARDWIAVAQAGWSDGSNFAFSVSEVGRGNFLGACSLSHMHPIYHFCNLGYWIRSSQRGHGFAGRAARLAARFAFERLKLLRVEILSATTNEASQKVADKIGAHREGILFNRMVVRSVVCDAVMYSLIPSDFGFPASL